MNRAALETAVVNAMTAACEKEMQWGVDDCTLWCANIIRNTLGYDPAKNARGRYKTRNGARRFLGTAGLKGALTKAARRHKWKRINPEYARPGDVGLAWTTVEVRGKQVTTLATMICRAPGWFVGRNERGFTAINSNMIVAAWSVLDDAHPGPRVRFHSHKRQLVPTSAVNHEPVSIGIAVLSAIGITGTSAVVAGIVGGLVLMTVSVGLSLVASLLQPHKGTGSIDSALADSSVAQSVQITERQSIPYRRHILGGAYVGGALFFEQVKPPYLTLGTLLAEGVVSGITKVVVGTNTIAFPSSIVENQILTPVNVDGQPNYENRLASSFRFGQTNQTKDALIAADYPNIDAEFRQRGIATAVMRYHFGANQDEFLRLWGQVSRPNAYYFVKGERVYDPRDPNHVRQPDRADYPVPADYDAAFESARATWSWTNNATLLQAHYLVQEWGGQIPPSKINWSRIIESADYDDEVIGCKDGTFVKRHTIDGVVLLNQKPAEVIRKLLTANRAMILAAGGKVWIQSAKPRSPVITINDKMLASGIKYQSTKSKVDLINKLQVRVVVPDQDYQIVDGPVLNRTDLQTIDNGVLPGTLSLDYTLDEHANCPRAQRLQKLFLASSRLGRTITGIVDSRLIALADDELIGAVVNFESSLFSNANGQYMVTSIGMTEDTMGLSLALTEYNGAIENDYDPAVDEKDFDLADLNLT